MDTRTAILTRRTIHAFTTAHLPEGALDRALEAAHQAPCHKHTWPWRFVVLGPITRAAITDRIIERKRSKSPDDPLLAQSIREKRDTCPVALAVLQALAPDPKRQKEDYAAIACAIQNLQLSLWSEGVGAKWDTGGIDDPVIVTALGLDPQVEACVGFVFAGKAAKVPSPARPPWTSVIRTLP